jgi:hypothetical protein
LTSNIVYCSPTEDELNAIVKEWWAKLDDNNGQPLKEGQLSGNKKYVYLYGHYDMLGYAAGAHEGVVREEHRDLTIFAPLLNGRYGTAEFMNQEYGDAKTGVLLSQYATDLHASLLRGNVVIDIPQVHWISHELPRAHELKDGEFYYGVWICIDGHSLKAGDTLLFGGKGGPHVASKDKSDWLQRFETHATWHIS